MNSCKNFWSLEDNLLILKISGQVLKNPVLINPTVWIWPLLEYLSKRVPLVGELAFCGYFSLCYIVHISAETRSNYCPFRQWARWYNRWSIFLSSFSFSLCTFLWKTGFMVKRGGAYARHNNWLTIKMIKTKSPTACLISRPFFLKIDLRNIYLVIMLLASPVSEMNCL